MTTIHTLGIGLVFSTLAIGLASAQTSTTGTGGDALSTDKAPNTTVVGQTKPPSRDASPTSVKAIDRPMSRQATDDAFGRRICNGCVTDPGETRSLSIRHPVDVWQKTRDVRLDELRMTAEPQRQTDLDTVALASAPREQAKSMEEKTTGLWRSWLTSVCDGCGDQKPAKALKPEDWPMRDKLATTGSVDHKSAQDKVQPDAIKRVRFRSRDSLAADLSPENIGTIRRMPRE